MHCRGEISIALLGQNQTTEASANRASATAGLQVTEDLRDGDAKIVAAAINQLIKWICELNYSGAAAPVFSFWDQPAQDDLQAKRDKSNYDAGARFTNDYWMRAYGYQEGDLAQPGTPLLPAGAAGSIAPIANAANFAEAALVPDSTDPLAAEGNALANAADPAMSAMLAQIQALVDKATSYHQLQDALTQAYGGLDSDQLVKVMAAGFALAELKGLADVKAGA